MLKPISAHGFDALNLSDSGNENDNQAANAIDGNPAGWTSQDYATAALGNLKAGTGLILDMGRPVKLSSVTIQFGASAGADVQIKMGNSNTRSTDNLQSMQTVASGTDVGGTFVFRATTAGTGQYVVIWFTKMPTGRQRRVRGQDFVYHRAGHSHVELAGPPRNAARRRGGATQAPDAGAARAAGSAAR